MKLIDGKSTKQYPKGLLPNGDEGEMGKGFGRDLVSYYSDIVLDNFIDDKEIVIVDMEDTGYLLFTISRAVMAF
ncbi:hypothetical protein PT974_04403 [Cladobotryum mycophilum]|uniref:Uncharacterized protein n=1 Tax=Cladobotryum mycophilum TaxID=491253 RepID=A0ABR0SV06_9HYPO